MKSLMSLCGVMLMSGCSLIGFSRLPAPEAVPVEYAALVEAGQTNRAAQLLVDVLKSERHAPVHPWAYEMRLRVPLQEGNPAAAQAIVLDALAAAAPYAESGVTLVFQSLRETDCTNALAWLETCLGRPLSAGLRQTVVPLHLETLKGVRGTETVRAALGGYLGEEGDAMPLLATRTAYTLAAQDNADAECEAILALADTKAEGRPALASFVAMMRIDRLAARSDWAGAVKAFTETRTRLVEDDLLACVRNLLNLARGGGQDAVVDSFLRLLLTAKPATGRRCEDLAAREWVNQVESKTPASIPERIEELLAMGVAPELVANVHAYWLSWVTERQDQAIAKRLLATSRKLEDVGKGAFDAKTLEMLRASTLDACYIADDFAEALAQLKKGIPERDEAWHKVAINKTEAHIALQNGDIDGAVAKFREFMAYVKTMEEPTWDPSTGLQFTRTMLLGRNAKRIGDIYAKAGRAGDASTAYKEAAGYYDAALKELKDGSQEVVLVKKELGEIPQSER